MLYLGSIILYCWIALFNWPGNNPFFFFFHLINFSYYFFQFMLIKTAIETDKFGLTLPNTTPKNPISADIWGGPFFFFFRV